MKKTKTLLMALSLGLGVNAFAGEPSFGSGDVVAFSADGGNTWICSEPKASYVFQVEQGQTGIIKFNPEYEKQDISVQGQFMMVGENFQIDTAGKNITFAQPMANYDTNFTLMGGGSVTTLQAAAFKSLNIEGGNGNVTVLKINSQIGVTDSFTVGGYGKLELMQDSQLLLTQPIHNLENGTIEIHSGAIVDASNLSHDAAVELNVKYINTNGEVNQNNGFLYGGPDVKWSIVSQDSQGTIQADTGETGQAQLKVGDLMLNIESNGDIKNEKPRYAMWFQNNGESPDVSEILRYAGHEDRGEDRVSNVSLTVNGGDIDPSSGQRGELTVINVDQQVSDTNVLYVARGTGAKIIQCIDLSTQMGSIGNLTLSDNTYTELTGIPGWQTGALKNVTMYGQNIELKMVHDEATYYSTTEFAAFNLTVEAASSARIEGDINPEMGYYVGTISDETHKNPPNKYVYHAGDYNIKGVLTLASTSTMDMRKAMYTTSYANAELFQDGKATKATFQEDFAHLTLDANGAILLEEGAKFFAATVSSDASLKDNNLDTEWTAEEADYNQTTFKIDRPQSSGKYEINGTVTIESPNGKASLTSEGLEAGHYTTRNYGFTLTDAKLTVTDGIDKYNSAYMGEKKDTIISNILIGDSVTNDKQNHGTVTLDNKKNENFDTLDANQGDIAITNNTSVDAKTVHLGAGREVSVSSETPVAPAELLRDGSLTVTEVLKADGYKGTEEGKDNYSKIGADLYLVAGSELDVSAAGGNGGIDMLDNTVTLKNSTSGSGIWTLSEEVYNQLWAMEKGDKYDLFFEVSAFDYGEEPTTEEIAPEALDASRFFSNFKAGWFYLCYSGASGEGGAGGNVGTIYLYSMVPEPTTGTLSLLALAGLAARRRKK